MGNNNKYVRNFSEITRERVGDKIYKQRDMVRAKWEHVSNPGEYCGNFSSDVKVTKDGTFKMKTKKERDSFACDFNLPGVYDVMPSAMWLYRIGCTFACQINLEGPEGYKVVWSASFRHKETGCMIHFYEWKGAFTFGASGESEDHRTVSNKVFHKDCLELLNYLSSETCAHPYDGCVAGFVA